MDDIEVFVKTIVMLFLGMFFGLAMKKSRIDGRMFLQSIAELKNAK